jgi:hypothetical protein
MADNERDVWQAPRNTGIGALADALAASKRGLNYVQLADLLGSPMLAGTAVRRNLASGNEGLGVGDLLLGQAPEEVDRWSYGDSPFYEQHYGFNPTIRPDRRGNIVDTALLPVGEAVGAAKLMGRGAIKATEKAGIKSLLKDSAPAVEATDKGRRAVLKGLAAVPAAAAAAHVAPKLFEKTAVKGVEKIAEKAVTPGSMFDYLDAVRKAKSESLKTAQILAEKLGPETPLEKLIAFRNQAQEQILAEKLNKLKKDPRFTKQQAEAWDEYDKASEAKKLESYDPEYDDIEFEDNYEAYEAAEERAYRAKNNLGWQPEHKIYDAVMRDGVYQDPFNGITYKRVGDKIQVQHPRKGEVTLNKEDVHGWAEKINEEMIWNPDRDAHLRRWYGEDHPDLHRDREKDDLTGADIEEAQRLSSNFYNKKFLEEHPRLHKALTFMGSTSNYKAGGMIENTTHDRKLI